MTILWIIVGIYAGVTSLFGLSLWLKNPAIVDVYWALGIALAACGLGVMAPLSLPG